MALHVGYCPLLNETENISIWRALDGEAPNGAGRGSGASLLKSGRSFGERQSSSLRARLI